MNWTQWLGIAAGSALVYGLGRKVLHDRGAQKALPEQSEATQQPPPEVRTDTINYRICPVCSNRVYDHEFFCIYCANAEKNKSLVVLNRGAEQALRN